MPQKIVENLPISNFTINDHSFKIKDNIAQGAIEDIAQAIVTNNSSISSRINNLNDRIELIEGEYYKKQYLTFISLEDNNIIGWKTSDDSFVKAISISIDGGVTWENKTSSNSTTLLAILNAGDKLIIKGSNSTYGNANYYNYFSSTGYFISEGNIMSLIYSDNFYNQTILSDSYTFKYLFTNCKLTNASNLVLPATTLSTYCYSNMFNSCSSLTTAPELPATTLAFKCYSEMFKSCTSLSSTPELPATTLANSCYHSMFSYCSILSSISELPATILTNECYDGMFSYCTSLTIAPELPATTLVNSCYKNMFQNCTSLNYIKCLATNITATDCTSSWVTNVSSTGTFVKGDNMELWTIGVNGIPENWSNYDETIYDSNKLKMSWRIVS